MFATEKTAGTWLTNTIGSLHSYNSTSIFQYLNTFFFFLFFCSVWFVYIQLHSAISCFLVWYTNTCVCDVSSVSDLLVTSFVCETSIQSPFTYHHKHRRNDRPKKKKEEKKTCTSSTLYTNTHRWSRIRIHLTSTHEPSKRRKIFIIKKVKHESNFVKPINDKSIYEYWIWSMCVQKNFQEFGHRKNIENKQW